HFVKNMGRRTSNLACLKRRSKHKLSRNNPCEMGYPAFTNEHWQRTLTLLQRASRACRYSLLRLDHIRSPFSNGNAWSYSVSRGNKWHNQGVSDLCGASQGVYAS
ncbi:hypothetical protein, partial [Phyllobacterium sp. CCNWLW183]|uniref:hypothetical protein n=1 Tax=Phyllobacterium sp. CCNWLW183 TaxID=3127482 RepID=UPI00307799B0